MNAALRKKLDEIALCPSLLIASDYDGTISPIASDPRSARPLQEALGALKSLGDLPQTSAAIVSGRALDDLKKLTKNPNGIFLIGSHGAEVDPQIVDDLSPKQKRVRASLLQDLKKITQKKKGFYIEEKPAGVSLHYRNANEEEAALVLKRTIEGPGHRHGVHIRHGSKVIELSVSFTTKGIALDQLRNRVGASAVLFFGDDRTDEDAFRSLLPGDIAVKVGDGASEAKFRVADSAEVVQVLGYLFQKRSSWLKTHGGYPIEDHSLLSDQRTVALVAPNGKINWLCLPRIDSGAVFADLLGGPSAGYFSIEPVGARSDPRQSYIPHTMSLVTEWPQLKLIDYLDCSGGRANQRAGRTDLVRVLSGRSKVKIVFAPRLDFGRVATRIKRKKDGLVLEDSQDPFVLRSPGVEWTIKKEGIHQTATAIVDLSKMGDLVLELRYGTGNLNASLIDEAKRRAQTQFFWSRWAKQLEIPNYPKEISNLVMRSALTLKALVHGPSGGIAAAATTSLPEHLGGVRNWDYRFTWLRDGAMSAQAMVDLGSIQEAMDFLDWVLDIVDRAENPERLRPLYSVTGGTVMAEAEITDLPGYAGSKPVRVGNGAAHQVQLDVFGAVVELIYHLALRGAPLSADHWRLVDAMVKAVEHRWHEPDHGIWEVRTAKRHYVHSKIMCWVTVDRAIVLSEKLLGYSNRGWQKLRKKIKDDILQKSWNDKMNSFTSYYGGSEIDASVLYLGLMGVISGKDPRFKKTVTAVEKHLLKSNTVFRYLMDDGLPGDEGGFHICTCWLIQSYILIGRKKDAHNLFRAYLKSAGSTGLIPEELNVKTGKGLGNHPQAYSHLALIQTAQKLREQKII